MSKFAVILCFLIFAVSVAGQSLAAENGAATRIGLQDVFLAKDDGSGHAGEAATSFSTTDIPIYCVVQLSAPRAAIVKMVFVAVAVPGVKPETKVVTTTYTTREDQSRVNFTGKPAGKWTAGKYRVDVYVDDSIVTGLPFDIRSPAGNVYTATNFHLGSKGKPPLRPKRN